QLSSLIRESGAEPLPVVVERDGELLDLTVTPVVSERPTVDENNEYILDGDGEPVLGQVGFLGITPAQEMVRQPLLSVPRVVASTTWQTMTVVVTLPARIGDLVESQVNGTPRDANSIIG